MQKSTSLEADSRSDSQEIHRLLRNSNAHCFVEHTLALDPILSQFNSVHIFTRYFFKIHFNIIIPFKPRSSK